MRQSASHAKPIPNGLIQTGPVPEAGCCRFQSPWRLLKFRDDPFPEMGETKNEWHFAEIAIRESRMRRTLFLIVTLCCSAMPTLASAAACDSQELLDDLQWAIMDNGQRCASHQAFEDLINGACHRDTNQMNQGFTNCHPYDGQSGLDNWRLPRRAQTLTSRSLVTSRSLGIAASRSVGCPAATRRPRLWS